MTKRDDDSQADMEVGMTTAERRRRRRRGAGLRVPSDNVPRRSSTPPVVAPVPEDPSLAMSIAYSFTPDSSDPVIPRTTTHESPPPSFENHEGMPTVIDPVSGPVEQADFEMKTREMTAVDLEELGLSELGLSDPGSTMPFQRVSSPGLDPTTTTVPDAPVVEINFVGRDATEAGDDAEDDVEVDLDGSLDGVVDAGATLDQDAGRGLGDAEVDLDAAEATTIHPGPPAPPLELAARATEASQPRPMLAEISRPIMLPPMPAIASPLAINDGPPPRPIDPTGENPRPAGGAVGDPTPRARLSPIDPTGENPRPAGGAVGDPTPRARLSPIAGEGSQPRPAVPPPMPAVASPLAMNDGPPPRPIASEGSQPRPVAPPVPAGPGNDGSPRPPMASLAIPPVAPSQVSFRTGRAQTVALSEDDLEEVREAARLATHPPAPPQRPASTSIPPPMPPMPPKPAEARPRLVEPAPVSEIELTGFDDKGAEASGEFEVDVDGIVESKSDESGPVVAPPGAATEPRSRSLSPPPSPGYVAPAPPFVAPPGAPARDSQPMAPLRDAHAPPPVPGTARDSQPLTVVRDGHAPPPVPAVHKAPPSPPPPAKRDKSSPGLASPLVKPDARDAKADGKPPRTKPWFVELFDEDYLRTLPFLTPQATQAEAEFVINALALTPGAQVLDVGCGYGRHAMELAARGFHVVGLDLSTPLLVRGGEEALRRGLTINFVRGDMRELDFDAQFDGAYCLFSTFGYFDDETNKKTVSNIARALRPGGRVLIEILNRDYVITDLPTRVWWEGDGCVVLEEVELNYFSSRIQVNRSVVFDDGRQLEQDISVRAYSLHEVGKLLHSAGLRVLEVSGAYHTRGRFFGNQSRHIIVLAERKDPSAT